MLKIAYCEQGTDEWHKLRLGFFTASNFGLAITGTGKDPSESSRRGRDLYLYKLVGETLTGKAEKSYKSHAMERGNELEPFARAAYQEHTLEEVKQVGFIYDGGIGYSPDGLVGEDGLIEIKSPIASTFATYLYNRKVPTGYMPQIQGGLLVSGRKWCDFVAYHPDFDEDTIIIRVYRNEEFITKLKENLDKMIEKRDKILKQIKERK
tara:strand:- start:4995 stop:5618 length:624 start_codon:yes stop_codon:yes gene_type:complete